MVGSLVVVEAGHNRVLDQQNRTDLYVPRRTEKRIISHIAVVVFPMKV